MSRGLLIDATPIIPSIHLEHARARGTNKVRLDEGPQSKANRLLASSSLRAIGVSPTRAFCGRIDAARFRACPSSLTSPRNTVRVADVRPACCQTHTCCKTDPFIQWQRCAPANASMKEARLPAATILTGAALAQWAFRSRGCSGMRAPSGLRSNMPVSLAVAESEATVRCGDRRLRTKIDGARCRLLRLVLRSCVDSSKDKTNAKQGRGTLLDSHSQESAVRPHMCHAP